MKTIKYFLIAALALLCFYACDSRYSIIDNGVYITQAQNADSLKLEIGDKAVSTFLSFRMAMTIDNDVQVTYSLNQAVLDDYNARHKTHYTLLPSNSFTINKDVNSGFIKAGKVSSPKDVIVIQPLDKVQLPSDTYAIPVKIDNASGMRIQDTQDYLVILAHRKIADSK